MVSIKVDIMPRVVIRRSVILETPKENSDYNFKTKTHLREVIAYFPHVARMIRLRFFL